MSEDRINKSISFNKKDEYDLSLLQHAERINPLNGKKRNFSKYVKKLIESDMIGNKGTNMDRSDIQEKEEEKKNIEAMKGFL